MAKISTSTPINGKAINQERNLELASNNAVTTPISMKIMLIPNKWMWVHLRVQTNCSSL